MTASLRCGCHSRQPPSTALRRALNAAGFDPFEKNIRELQRAMARGQLTSARPATSVAPVDLRNARHDSFMWRGVYRAGVSRRVRVVGICAGTGTRIPSVAAKLNC